MTGDDFAEVDATCIECGKEVKLVVFGDSDTSCFVCPQCSQEHFTGLMDD